MTLDIVIMPLMLIYENIKHTYSIFIDQFGHTFAQFTQYQQ